MPPLPPNVTKTGLLRGLGGWNNSSLSRRSNTTRGLLSTRTPQEVGTTGGAILNPNIGIGTTRLAMPRNAAGAWRPNSITTDTTNTWDTTGTEIGTDITTALVGRNVAASGDYVIAASNPANPFGGLNSGIYVFDLTDPDNITEFQTGTDIPVVFGGSFSQDTYSVAISGDYAVVGAPNVSKAYVFVRTGPGNVWNTTGFELGTPGQQAGGFGHRVAISGDYAVVGAPNVNKAYVFVRTGPGNVWNTTGFELGTQEQQGIIAQDSFGDSVAISGNDIIVGGGVSELLLSIVGKAYVFRRTGPGNVWNTTGIELGTPEQQVEYFGYSVAISPNYAVVGSYAPNRVYVFFK